MGPLFASRREGSERRECGGSKCRSVDRVVAHETDKMSLCQWTVVEEGYDPPPPPPPTHTHTAQIE